jgi:hypothetical protein
MSEGATPSPQRKAKKLKKIRVQIGDDMDLNLGIYVSPRALTALTTLAAAVGGGGYILQR